MHQVQGIGASAERNDDRVAERARRSGVSLQTYLAAQLALLVATPGRRSTPAMTTAAPAPSTAMAPVNIQPVEAGAVTHTTTSAASSGGQANSSRR